SPSSVVCTHPTARARPRHRRLRHWTPINQMDTRRPRLPTTPDPHPLPDRPVPPRRTAPPPQPQKSPPLVEQTISEGILQRTLATRRLRIPPHPHNKVRHPPTHR